MPFFTCTRDIVEMRKINEIKKKTQKLLIENNIHQNYELTLKSQKIQKFLDLFFR